MWIFVKLHDNLCPHSFSTQAFLSFKTEKFSTTLGEVAETILIANAMIIASLRWIENAILRNGWSLFWIIFGGPSK